MLAFFYLISDDIINEWVCEIDDNEFIVLYYTCGINIEDSFKTNLFLSQSNAPQSQAFGWFFGVTRIKDQRFLFKLLLRIWSK